MDMKALIPTTAALTMIFAGTLPAADQHLVSLVMPDATVIADVNVAQAKNTPFGQYVLTLVTPQQQQLQAIAALTGFDPTRDVIEVLVATNGGQNSKTGLALASGAFNISSMTTAAIAAGATTVTYKGTTIIENPKDNTYGFAFLNASTAVAGDLAGVESAIDRLTSGPHLSSTIVTQINQLSASYDAWVLTTVAPSTLTPPANAPTIQGLNLQALQQIQQASAGVKLGTTVTVAALAQFDTAQNAATAAGMIQLLVNMAQMQAQKNPQAAQLANNVTATANGATMTVSFSLAEAQLQQLVQNRDRKASIKVAPKKK